LTKLLNLATLLARVATRKIIVYALLAQAGAEKFSK
tara:strand:- start:425 stop:532 length:108 start_codon:yes stop_codon:yes gene_type:complete